MPVTQRSYEVASNYLSLLIKTVAAQWNEADHPREPAGSSEGGQFADSDADGNEWGEGVTAGVPSDHSQDAVGFDRSPWDFKKYRNAPDLRRQVTDVGGALAIRDALRDLGRLNEDGRTTSLYHVTLNDPDTLEGIRVRGLVPAAQRAPGQTWEADHSKYATYFHSSRDAAEANVEQAGGIKNATIIEVRLPVTPKALIRVIPDEDTGLGVTKGVRSLLDGTAVAVIGGVPPAHILIHASRGGAKKSVEWNEADHPREPAGSSEGGRFTSADVDSLVPLSVAELEALEYEGMEKLREKYTFALKSKYDINVDYKPGHRGILDRTFILQEAYHALKEMEQVFPAPKGVFISLNLNDPSIPGSGADCSSNGLGFSIIRFTNSDSSYELDKIYKNTAAADAASGNRSIGAVLEGGMRTLFRHEYAHALDNATSGVASSQFNRAARAVTSVLGADPWSSVSQYAGTNRKEFFAEAFAKLTFPGTVVQRGSDFDKVASFLNGSLNLSFNQKVRVRYEDDAKKSVEWNESEHPREPAGSSEGGRFTHSGSDLGAYMAGIAAHVAKKAADFEELPLGVGFDGMKQEEIDRFAKKYLDKVQERIGESHVAIHVDGLKTLEMIVNEGRYKTQHEHRASGGFYDPPLREQVENSPFGLNPDTPAGDRPVYGVLRTKAEEEGVTMFGSEEVYGQITLVLKDSVRNRTTWTGGDSINESFVPSLVAGRVSPATVFDDDDRTASVNYRSDRIRRLGDALRDDEQTGPLKPYGTVPGHFSPSNIVSPNGPYAEAQVHGGVSIEDIKEVRIRGGEQVFKSRVYRRVVNSLLGKGVDVFSRRDHTWASWRVEKLR